MTVAVEKTAVSTNRETLTASAYREVDDPFHSRLRIDDFGHYGGYPPTSCQSHLHYARIPVQTNCRKHERSHSRDDSQANEYLMSAAKTSYFVNKRDLQGFLLVACIHMCTVRTIFGQVFDSEGF